jgi:valyl-tRNA synthetase
MKTTSPNLKKKNNLAQLQLPKRYDPKLVETKWQKFWLNQDIYELAYAFDKNDDTRPIFVIDTPPPFTSGELHMGHAYWNIINDTIARYKRMRGYNVILPQGWDCQGLPTELKVQKRWKIPRKNRELFREKCVEWTLQMISSMKKTMIKLGYRPDWEQFEYRTMDPDYWRRVQSTLLSFYDKDLIYRAVFPIHWCPNCETALAQAELGYVDKKGYLFYIKFPFHDNHLVIATTRPELLAACQALAVNCNDEKHLNLVGKKVELPLFMRKVPILADPTVDPEYGTGIVMICTFGDEQDIRWQQKYNLPILEIVNEQGVLINSGKYDGFNILEARKKIVSDLKNRGLISREEEIRHKVLSHTERSDCVSPVEFLVRKQVFIKIKPFKDLVISECEKMKWLPDYMLQRLIDWVHRIEWDWLISRQRIYGTPLPFWYCESCNELIPAKEQNLPVDPSKEKPPVDCCPKCGLQKIKALNDVCDCWVDSSITPLIISGYFDDKNLFKKAYPASTREQGHDIIRTWLFYTVFRCLMLTSQAPFQEVLINGHILGPDGYRMSKSKGNVINPEEKLEEYGADSLRQALLMLTLGSDFSFRWENVKYSKGFIQKYWSASKFAIRFIKNFTQLKAYAKHLTVIDNWILANLVKTINIINEALDNYQFHVAIESLRQFFWHEFCDQYLESVKHRLYDELNQENYLAAKYTIYAVLWNVTKILAPICPHITEEIYHILFNGEIQSIHACEWPKIQDIPFDQEAKNMGTQIMNVISAIRSQKAKASIPLNLNISKVTITVQKPLIPILQEFEKEITQILHIKEIQYKPDKQLEIKIQP